MSKRIKTEYYDIVRRPIITEKSSMVAEMGKFIFEVSCCADKSKVKNAIEAIFDVKVTQVNISNTHGKRKFFRGREGFRSGYKRAVVTLEQGQTIDFSGYKMSLKTFNPVTPSLRGTVTVDRSELWKGKPVKTLTVGKSGTGGRNNQGRITSWHKGGGHKQKYRLIDFKRKKFDMEAVVERIEYDPNRTAFIALIRYTDGELSYIIAPQKLSIGDKVISGENVDIKPGNAMPLRNMPIGTMVHNVEMKPGKGGQLARSAGAYIQLVGKDVGNAQLRLRSGELRVVSVNCIATIGVVSNPDQQNIKIGKAGRNRWLGKRPVVRGVAMNPIDHPHGGGEGKTSGGRHPCTPWGKSTKGKKTRKNKFTSKFIIRSRHVEKGKDR